MIIETITIVGIALSLDFVFGDPRNRYHPTAWIGSIIGYLTPFAKNSKSMYEKLGGIFVVMVPCFIVVMLLILLDLSFYFETNYLTIIISILVSAILLKTTIAIRGMEKHALSVIRSLDQNNIDSARENLSMIVKRNTKNLDKKHLISGVLESISENTVDGVTGPLFYYGLFGLPGAFVYRIVNTADSMIGYKNNIFKNIGWFGAKSDTVLNYVPSRLTCIVMIIAAIILKQNWRDCYRVMVRDGKKTESPNAGYPMAALAGALSTTFEKIDHYNLGYVDTELTQEHVYSALKMMKLTSILFVGFTTIPMILILSYFGWWLHA